MAEKGCSLEEIVEVAKRVASGMGKDLLARICGRRFGIK